MRVRATGFEHAAGRIATFLGVVGAVAVAACTGEPTPFGPPPPAPAATVDPRALVWALESAPTTLDAARAGTDLAALQVANQVNNGLFRYNADSLEIVGDLAENWDVDVGGRTYTFTLRQGVVFQDGTPLDSRAVKWNFDRWRLPDHQEHKGRFLQWLSLFGTHDDNGIVEKVEALDALTLRVTLRQPFAPFIQHLANPAFGIASDRAVIAAGEAYGADGEHLPIGSGPYRVAAWDKNSGVVQLEANARYWGTPAKTPNLVFAAIPDAARRAEALAAGVVAGAGFTPTMVTTGTLAAPDVRIVPRPARANAWLMLDTAASPLSDKRVREAIHLTIDRTALAGAHFGSHALPSNQLLPPGFLGHDDGLLVPPADVERAKALLAEADLADGFPLRIWVPDQPRPYLPDPLGTAAAIVEMLKAIGIDATVNPISARRLLDNRDRAYRAWLIGWEAQTSDPDSMWYWHFGPANTNTEGHYKNADLFKLLLEAQRTTAQSDRRRTLYESAMTIVAADVPRIFLANARPFVAIGSRVEGYVPGAMGYDAFAGVGQSELAVGAPPPPLEDFLPPTSTPAAVEDAALPGGAPTAETAPAASTSAPTAPSPPTTTSPATTPTATAAGPARSRSDP